MTTARSQMSADGWYSDMEMLVNAPHMLGKRPKHTGWAGLDYGLVFLREGNPRAKLLMHVCAVQHGRREFYVWISRDRIIFADPDREDELARGYTSGCEPRTYWDEQGAVLAAARLAAGLHAGGRPPADWDGTEPGFPAGARVLRQCPGCIVLVPDGAQHTCLEEDRLRRLRHRR